MKKNLKFGENIAFGKIESEWEWEREVSVRELEKIVIERWESEWEWEIVKREMREWVRVRDSEERDDERLSERSECERNGGIWGEGKREER